MDGGQRPNLCCSRINYILIFVWLLSLILLHIDVLSHNYCGCIALYVYTTFVHSTVNGSRIVICFWTL